jgi:hypothetical protein
MTQSATWDTLQIARDARLSGLASQYEELLAEAAPDFEYVRMTGRRRAHSFVFDDGRDLYDDDEGDWEPESRSDQRRNWADAQRWLFSPSLLEWPKPLKLTAFDRMMREMYTPDAVSHMAYRSNPSFAEFTKQGDDSGFEMRIRSWANYIVPVRGVFPVD